MIIIPDNSNVIRNTRSCFLLENTQPHSSVLAIDQNALITFAVSRIRLLSLSCPFTHFFFYFINLIWTSSCKCSYLHGKPWLECPSCSTFRRSPHIRLSSDNTQCHSLSHSIQYQPIFFPMEKNFSRS